MKWQNRGHEFDGLGAYFQEHADIYIYTDEGYAHTLAAALTFLKREIRLIDPSVNQAEGSRVPLREVLGRPEGKLVLIPIGYPDPDGIRRTLEDGIGGGGGTGGIGTSSGRLTLWTASCQCTPCMWRTSCISRPYRSYPQRSAI